MTTTFLHVAIEGALAGYLVRTSSQRLAFHYAEGYGSAGGAVPLSGRWPPDGGAQQHDATNWVENLLPENQNVREQWATANGAASTDAFDMLATRLGLDCAGAVQFSVDEGEWNVRGDEGQRDWLTDDEVLEAVDRTVRVDALTSGGHLMNVNFTLAGAQRKLTLGYDPASSRWYRPSTHTPSTHVIKPVRRVTEAEWDPERMPVPNQVVIEHLTMRTAAYCGVTVAASSVAHFGPHVAIISERYDRVRREDGVQRIHQEDLCQALDLPPRAKGERHRGVTTALLSEQLAALGVAGADRFFEALVFNWAVGGSDAHAKNYSILLGRQRQVMAPLYDLTSAFPFNPLEVHDEIPLMMRGAASGYELRDFDDATVWQRTAEMCRVSVDVAVEIMERITERVEPAARAAVNSLDDATAALSPVDKFHPAIERRAATLKSVATDFKRRLATRRRRSDRDAGTPA